VHGRSRLNGKAGAGGKVPAKSWTAPGEATLEMYEAHLHGQGAGLGILPIRDWDTCWFGAIDIDLKTPAPIVPTDHAGWARRVAELGLPLTVCASKSGGTHLDLFLKQPGRAKLVQLALAGMARRLGLPENLEIFPKQDRAGRNEAPPPKKDEPDKLDCEGYGSWLNLPYCGSTRPAYGPEGQKLSLEEFLERAEALSIQPEQLERYVVTTPGQSGSDGAPRPAGERKRSAKESEGRDGYLYSTTCSLLARGTDPDTVLATISALNSSATPSEHPNFADGPLPEQDVRRIVKSAIKKQAKAEKKEPHNDPRPVIRVAGGMGYENAVKLASILGAATRAEPFDGIYWYGQGLMRVGRLRGDEERKASGVEYAENTLLMTPVTIDYLVALLTKLVRWEKYDGRKDDWVQTDAHETTVRHFFALASQLGHIPWLYGIIEAPTIRPDGTMLDQPGYDRATGLLFDPGGVEFLPVPEKPTREQAEEALRVLREPLAEFPFEADGSESVALAMLITALVRRPMDNAPIHVMNAYKMASGKTLLAKLAGIIATGREPPMMNQARNAEEEGKRLIAFMMEGSPMLVIDNVSYGLHSNALCTITTAKSYKDRILGVSKNFTGLTNFLVVVNGNNVELEGDLSTRAVVATIDPACEDPGSREFKLDLLQWVPANRLRLVQAGLTIVRAYLTNERPVKGTLPVFGRFESWSTMVREPLVWLGMEDPCLTRAKLEQNDTVRSKLGALLSAWRVNYGDKAASVADAVRLATTDAPLGDDDRAKEKRQQLHDALQETGRGGIKDTRSIGQFIAGQAKRFEGGLRFVEAGTKAGTRRWRVTTQAESRGTAQAGQLDLAESEGAAATGPLELVPASEWHHADDEPAPAEHEDSIPF
jgi:hypothetical protein